MSDSPGLIVAGKEEFTLPFALLGMKCRIASGTAELASVIDEESAKGIRSYIVDETVADMALVEKYEEMGSTILLLNPWGSSERAGEKIRMASIKAIGTELKEN